MAPVRRSTRNAARPQPDYRKSSTPEEDESASGASTPISATPDLEPEERAEEASPHRGTGRSKRRGTMKDSPLNVKDAEAMAKEQKVETRMTRKRKRESISGIAGDGGGEVGGVEEAAGNVRRNERGNSDAAGERDGRDEVPASSSISSKSVGDAASSQPSTRRVSNGSTKSTTSANRPPSPSPSPATTSKTPSKSTPPKSKKPATKQLKLTTKPIAPPPKQTPPNSKKKSYRRTPKSLLSATTTPTIEVPQPTFLPPDSTPTPSITTATPTPPPSTRAQTEEPDLFASLTTSSSPVAPQPAFISPPNKRIEPAIIPPYDPPKIPVEFLSGEVRAHMLRLLHEGWRHFRYRIPRAGDEKHWWAMRNARMWETFCVGEAWGRGVAAVEGVMGEKKGARGVCEDAVKGVCEFVTRRGWEGEGRVLEALGVVDMEGKVGEMGWRAVERECEGLGWFK